MERGILIGIAGGSGSGKTLVAETIYSELGSDRVIILCQDSYYKDLSHLPPEQRHAQNFDHPDSINAQLLIDHAKALLEGKTIEQPVYDFVTHTLTGKTKTIGPHSIIVLEGILIFYNPELRELMDIKLFVDTDSDIRLIRRLRRDTVERGRTMESVINQYEKSVRPMHLQFVEPTKRYADLIVPEGGYNRVAIDVIKTKIEALLKNET
ncbi:uridine kinase [candidate division KSB1 bacterium]|nr:uridine kinase [candidate division KSB1 bacterium]NIR70357.1 uridine kinase [candidate division KSB1 bacterium]NIS24481.1 uridine kinase [candidate division KSB1 bacterium]NIT71409.1 uridine kinase [candidate division KSB1 bacterium]NIU23544.1 uridine kinase [candidate division KSB1 bacterium]